MQNYSQQLAGAIAAMAKGASGSVLALSAPAAPRRRSISEILDVDRSFVTGYPLHVDKPDAVKAD